MNKFINFIILIREVCFGSLVLGGTWLLAVGPSCGTGGAEVRVLANAIFALVFGVIMVACCTLYLVIKRDYRVVLMESVASLGVALFLSGMGYYLFGSPNSCSGEPSVGILMMFAGSIIAPLSLIKKN